MEKASAAAVDATAVRNDAAEASSAGGVTRERPPLAGLKLGRKDWLLFQLMRAGVHAFSLCPISFCIRSGYSAVLSATGLTAATSRSG